MKMKNANCNSLFVNFFSIFLLSLSLQWKIRRVLAHSIHEIAHMLGSNRTVSDLLSVVYEYTTKDLDDVKTGVLAHLSEFFEVHVHVHTLQIHVVVKCTCK